MLIPALWWLLRPDPGDSRLNAFIHERPQFPIVFTSRTEPASFAAASPHGEVFTYPGQPLWQAREGRLRLLTPRGTVHELTWGQALPDGGALIDVMSPSVSMDGTKIIFAGRRNDDHGHFRLYEIGIDGKGLRALTGGADDPGCTAVPPLRFAADGLSLLPDDERCRVDYDDVDPIFVDTASETIVFASSRTPDLGRGQARRSTTLWLMQRNTPNKLPLTANRYNDRWPFLMASNFLAFSLWSHNQEVISADERDIRPHQEGVADATAPVDSWMGAFTQTSGSQFGALVKTEMPVWRPRVLFNGDVVFMSVEDYHSFDHDKPDWTSLRVLAAPPGLLANVPSARPANVALPASDAAKFMRRPAMIDAASNVITRCATPSPCPPHHVVLAAAPSQRGEWKPESYGIYVSDQNNWGNSDDVLTLLFDDPELVDAEPVAVCARHSKLWPATSNAPATTKTSTSELTLANGKSYRGPAGTLFNSSLYAFQHGGLPGQNTDAGQSPIFAQPPAKSIHAIRIYASRRDRFDDPKEPRIRGNWELLVEAPTNGDNFGTRVPAGVPTVLAGVGDDGRIVRWTTAAKDSRGRQATFYAFAGDHYSAARPLGQHFCIGCHPGHSALGSMEQNHAERRKE